MKSHNLLILTSTLVVNAPFQGTSAKTTFDNVQAEPVDGEKTERNKVKPVQSTSTSASDTDGLTKDEEPKPFQDKL